MKLKINLQSFSYRKTVPQDTSGNGGGYIFDCRALINPGREEQYKKMTGLDAQVQQLLCSNSDVGAYLENVHNILEIAVNNYLLRSFTDLFVAFGCTGGQHRSVYCAEKTKQWLLNKYGDKVEIHITHRDMPSF
jgi:RNase adaptor protein for sRNA GlmZ degradation